MERAAQGRESAARLSRLSQLLTIAMLASPIGWRDGAHRRRIGVARTLARVAHQQPEVVLERAVFRELCELGSSSGTGLRAIFRCQRLRSLRGDRREASDRVQVTWLR